MCVSLVRAKIYRLAELTDQPLEEIQLIFDSNRYSETEKLLEIIMRLAQMPKDGFSVEARCIVDAVIFESAQTVFFKI